MALQFKVTVTNKKQYGEIESVANKHLSHLLNHIESAEYAGTRYHFRTKFANNLRGRKITLPCPKDTNNPTLKYKLKAEHGTINETKIDIIQYEFEGDDGTPITIIIPVISFKGFLMELNKLKKEWVITFNE